MPILPDDALPTEAGVVADLAALAAGVQHVPIDPDAVRLVLVREVVHNAESARTISTVKVLSLEPWAAEPERRKGTVCFDESESFASYVNEFKAPPATRLYASLSSRALTAVLNDDEPGREDAPHGAWRDHRAVLSVKTTPEWDRWRKADGHLVSQGEFAEHLELNLGDITEPVAADLVEIARSFTASTDVQFRSAVNLQTGETRFAYDENTQAQATGSGGSSIDIPRVFTLALAVFQGTDPITVTARLRYRLKNGNLSIGYLIDKADDIERQAFATEADVVSAETGLKVLYGNPASAATAAGA